MKYMRQGFTAVELLIALVVAIVLLGSAYQLYITVLTDSSAAQRRSQASNVAYSLLRGNQSYATNPCTTYSSAPAIPSYANLTNATAALTISCPFGTSSSVSLVSVTVTYYDSMQQQVTRALNIKQ